MVKSNSRTLAGDVVVHNSLGQSASIDFDQIWSYYSGDTNSRPADPLKIKSGIRAVHRFGFVSAILTKAISETQAEHKRIFLKECSSDAIHMLHTLLVGDLRSGHFYLRSAVENLWRHIYFKDHPVEYRWLNSDTALYQSIDNLRSYCKKTDEIERCLHKSLDRIAGGYSELSGFVHSTDATSLQLHGMLSEIRLSTEGVGKLVSYIRTFGRDLILVCLVLHEVDLGCLHPREKRFAIDYLDRSRKQLRLKALS